MKALSIGRLAYDVNIILDGYPEEYGKMKTQEVISCSGGAANIVAYSLAKWNVESYISGAIGYDGMGSSIKKSMEDSNVKTNYLETNYDIKTPTSYILVNKKNNSRTIITNDTENYNLKKFEYDINMDLVIVDGYLYNASVYAFNKYKDAVTVLNAKTPHAGLLDYFKYAKYVVCSSTVAEEMTGLKIDTKNPITISNVYKRIIDKYPHINLLITMEGFGTAYCVGNEIKVLATINTEVIDKTGARDIFVAMIGYGLTVGYEMDVIVRLATIAESMSKKSVGAVLSTPTLSEVITYYESKFGHLGQSSESSGEVKDNAPTA